MNFLSQISPICYSLLISASDQVTEFEGHYKIQSLRSVHANPLQSVVPFAVLDIGHTCIKVTAFEVRGL
jgi:hypothetical protein